MLINVYFDPLFYWNCKNCQKSSSCRYLQNANIFADSLNYLLSSFPRPICESLSSQNAKIWIRQLFKFCRPRIRQFLKGKFIPSGLCAVRGAGCEPGGEFVWQSSKPQGLTTLLNKHTSSPTLSANANIRGQLSKEARTEQISSLFSSFSLLIETTLCLWGFHVCSSGCGPKIWAKWSGDGSYVFN